MPAKLILIARAVAIVVIVVAIALIIIRWKFPSTYRSDDGSGSVWGAVWRRWIERRRKQRERRADLKTLRGKLALLVDPDEKTSRVMSWQLGVLRCRSMRTRTGANGINRARAQKPDVVFVDALLTDMSAVEFYNSLALPGVAVVFVGVLEAQWDGLCMLGPMVRCIPKPFEPEDAAALAGRLLRRGQI